MKKIAVIIPFVLLLSACATKQYPQAAAVSGEESALMNCHDIKTEIAKTRSIQQEIEKTGQFDGKTVLGFLGDFGIGIGNGIAKDDARAKATVRLSQLTALQEKNCR
ncbi:hypothetical protein PRH55_003552 [Morganella morganii]|nr:hypothetical protein [Morganella morganii]ELB1014598.1 hypothetical protein [Morganella morganii]HCT1399144.1 hypothetical protein [Morganella morganii]